MVTSFTTQSQISRQMPTKVDTGILDGETLIYFASTYIQELHCWIIWIYDVMLVIVENLSFIIFCIF